MKSETTSPVFSRPLWLTTGLDWLLACDRLLAWPLIGLIYIYRYTFGPYLGNSCRFYPTCSHYGEEALRKYGACRGSIMTIARMLRCNPWSDGGYDPVN